MKLSRRWRRSRAADAYDEKINVIASAVGQAQTAGGKVLVAPDGGVIGKVPSGGVAAWGVAVVGKMVTGGFVLGCDTSTRAAEHHGVNMALLGAEKLGC